MLSSFFKKKSKHSPLDDAPSVMGLRLRGSFDIDPLLLKMFESSLIIDGAATSYIIKAAGVVELDGTWMFRFYTDDDAFIQVITEGGKLDEHVVDVKLFHFYDTQDVPTQAIWDSLLNEKIGGATYQLEGHSYNRVWTSVSHYHNPVHMQERTYDETGTFSDTDQFVMLFERPISDENTESLFLSAEETIEEGNLTRCLVLSTGITLSPSQLTVHG
ncbi:MAG: hypothetical protein ACI9Y1_003335 [Lentisphaeria bacterium]|jgi:hypothetical protein